MVYIGIMESIIAQKAVENKTTDRAEFTFRDFENDYEEYTISIPMSIADDKSGIFRKFFDYTIEKAIEQHFPEEIVIDIREMPLHWFSSVDNAARAYNDFCITMQRIDIMKTIEKDGDIVERGGPLFSHRSCDGYMFRIQIGQLLLPFDCQLQEESKNGLMVPTWAGETAYSMLLGIYRLWYQYTMYREGKERRR